MPIEITIINSPSNVNVGQSNHTFPDAGGTLGRGSNNFWILEDPNKYMSSVHAKIACVAEQYFLTDLSTNGTFINGASEPIGNGNQIALNDGDHFTISDYEFIANIANAINNADIFQSHSTDPFADFADANEFAPGQDDFMSSSPSSLSNNDPFASGITQSSSVNNPLSAFDAEQIDPLELLDNAQSASDPFAMPISGLDNFSPNNGQDAFVASSSTSIESNNVATDSISWPSANQDASLIPDDWDDEDLMSDFSPAVVAPAAVPPSYETPVYQAAVQQAPAYETPAYQAPVQQEPVYETPAYQAPVQPAPVYEPPVEQAPQEQSQAPAVSAVPAQTRLDSDIEYTQLKYSQLKLKNQQLAREVEQLKQQLLQAQSTQSAPGAEANASVNSRGETHSVINAMGLAKWNLDDKKVAEINDTVGLLMRETMQGMMRVLKFRKKIKEEFRINVTTIQSVENNPLKFSANIDDAMENMFIKENNAYKAPVDAVKEGFQGIAEHQVAVIAGMQAAFRGMIERFDPSNLESRFEKYKSSSLLSLGQKSKRWAAYKEYHQGLTENLDDSFQHLFGYDFVQAYEDQMQRLISARLSPNESDKDESIN